MFLPASVCLLLRQITQYSTIGPGFFHKDLNKIFLAVWRGARNNRLDVDDNADHNPDPRFSTVLYLLTASRFLRRAKCETYKWSAAECFLPNQLPSSVEVSL